MIILAVVGAAGGLLLVWAGVDHLREPGVLAAHLPVGKGASAGMAVAEILVGAGALVALATPVVVGRLFLAGQGLFYAAFLGHLWLRHRRNDRADCGCGRVSARIGVAGLLRAGVLAAVSGAAAAGYPSVPPDRFALAEPALALILAGGVVLCLVLHALPAAVDGLAHPKRRLT
jgi:hypothetical protein